VWASRPKPPCSLESKVQTSLSFEAPIRSGLTSVASQELRAAFQTLVSYPGILRGLLVEIEKEELVPSTRIPCLQDFYGDLEIVARQLTTTKATYIVLRRYEGKSAGAFAAITYVPDTAPVRQKMLFASTRLTLARELGVEHFRESLFATTTAELTAKGWKAQEAHGELAAPLTEEEAGQKQLREAEEQEGTSRGTTQRQSHVASAGMSMKLGSGVKEALSGLSRGGRENLIQLKIDVRSETIRLADEGSVEPGELSLSISNSEPRYSFYRFEHTYEGESLHPVVFLYTCPTGSKIKERMVYASTRAFISNLAEGEGVKIEKKVGSECCMPPLHDND